ncbi:MAG TPA: TfoX/Sxy family protein [Syntrophobacteraceae bacterium]|nr:TfoX/Sxy family protein [Syntrophobacteraceae bacterium]
MPYDPGLAVRLEELFEGHAGFEHKKMFGGICWLLNGKMFAGVYKDRLIIRVGEETAVKILKEKHVKPFDITGKPMKGWAMVAPEGIEDDKALKRYLSLAERFVKILPSKN